MANAETVDFASKLKLNGKRVLVTGGGSGIGHAIAETFLGSGALVHIADVNADAIASFVQESGASGSVCDIGDPDAVEQCFRDAQKHLGGLDILVNNAGIAGPTAKPEEIAIEDWDAVIRVNVNGTFYCIRQAIPLLKQSGGGVIINLSSAAILRGGFPMRLPYAVSKTATLGFTETLAMDLGVEGIRVHSILPGSVDGPRVHAIWQSLANSSGQTLDDLRAYAQNATSMRKIVSPYDIADMVCFLCTDAAKNISCQSISVCGNFEGHRSALV